MLRCVSTTARSMTFCNWRTLPGQVVAEKRVVGFRLDGEERLVHLRAEALEEELRRARGCPRCGRAAAGWPEREGVEAVEEILAQAAVAGWLPPGGDCWRRRGGNRRLHRSACCRAGGIRAPAKRAKIASGDSTGISAISSRKSVPSAGGAEHAGEVLAGAGERTLLITEELALNHVGGERGAVELDQRAFGPNGR